MTNTRLTCIWRRLRPGHARDGGHVTFRSGAPSEEQEDRETPSLVLDLGGGPELDVGEAGRPRQLGQGVADRSRGGGSPRRPRRGTSRPRRRGRPARSGRRAAAGAGWRPGRRGVSSRWWSTSSDTARSNGSPGGGSAVRSKRTAVTLPVATGARASRARPRASRRRVLPGPPRRRRRRRRPAPARAAPCPRRCRSSARPGAAARSPGSRAATSRHALVVRACPSRAHARRRRSRGRGRAPARPKEVSVAIGRHARATPGLRCAARPRRAARPVRPP